MKPTIQNKKKGSILVIVMVIVVTVTLLVAVMLRLGSFSQIETIQQLRTTQAHWLAEAGLERALSWVAASKDYRKDLPGSEPSDYSAPNGNQLGNGEYILKVWEPVTDERIIIQSMGSTTNSGLSGSVTVQLDMGYSGGIPGAIVGLSTPGHTDLGSDVEVLNGDVYRNGTMEIRGTLDPDHVAHATEDGSPYGSGSYAEGYISPPDPPVIDSDGRLANLLNDAIGHTNTTFTGALAGTVYIDDDVVVTSDITGSGTLVVTGDLEFNGSKLDVADGVEIVVNEDITVSQHTSFGDDVLIFSQDGNISLQQDIDGGTVAIIAKNGSLGHITVEYDNNRPLGDIDTANLLPQGQAIGDPKPNKPSFSGIFYAGYDIIFSMKADIHGTIIAGRHMDLGKDTGNIMRVTYDPSVFSDDWPIDFGNEIVILNSSWQVVRNP